MYNSTKEQKKQYQGKQDKPNNKQNTPRNTINRKIYRGTSKCMRKPFSYTNGRINIEIKAHTFCFCRAMFTKQRINNENNGVDRYQRGENTLK